jgi:hypothetical protein
VNSFLELIAVGILENFSFGFDDLILGVAVLMTFAGQFVEL